MKVLSSRKALKALVFSLKNKKWSIGFVPTMGYLHEGHLSLAKKSVDQNDFTVASIFVNPLQFGPKEDLKRYPRNFARDKALLQSAGVDALFVPDTDEFYPESFQTTVSVKRLSKPLCGRTRPIHFEGVATVVLKLLNLVEPDRLYLGQKDYQQCRVIEQMIEDLDLGVRVLRLPIVRESDGLAMSSRNVYLSTLERAQAVVLSQALLHAKDLIAAGAQNTSMLKAQILRLIAVAPKARVDYAEIVDAHTLEPVVKLKKGQTVVVALAVYFSKTRLIDNILIKVA